MPDLAPSCSYLPTLSLDFRSQSLETVYSPVRSSRASMGSICGIVAVNAMCGRIVIEIGASNLACSCDRLRGRTVRLCHLQSCTRPVLRPSVLASTTGCGTKIMHPLQCELFLARITCVARGLRSYSKGTGAAIGTGRQVKRFPHASLPLHILISFLRAPFTPLLHCTNTCSRVFVLSLCRPPQPQDSHLRCPRALLALSPASLRMSALRRLPPTSRAAGRLTALDEPSDPTDCLSTARMLCAHRSVRRCIHPPLDTPTVHTGSVIHTSRCPFPHVSG
ncbi:hypothetical protein B0H13DRAFT_2305396 [Mycena leptocephala]|nr:hypothetical protein B0H13DRAFT_2305396 [Mycena leptocephala]